MHIPEILRSEAAASNQTLPGLERHSVSKYVSTCAMDLPVRDGVGDRFAAVPAVSAKSGEARRSDRVCYTGGGTAGQPDMMSLVATRRGAGSTPSSSRTHRPCSRPRLGGRTKVGRCRAPGRADHLGIRPVPVRVGPNSPGPGR